MRQVHARVVAVLDGDSANVQTDNGQIVLNLFPLYNGSPPRVNGLNFDIARPARSRCRRSPTPRIRTPAARS